MHRFVFIFILILLLPSAAFSQAPQTVALADSSYFLQYPSLFFGTLCPGQTIESNFTIQNISSQPITVSEISAGAPFSIVTPTAPVPLNPGELIPIRVAVIVPGKGNFSAPFVIRLANRPTGDTLILRVTGRDNSIQISKSSIDFGDIPVNKSMTQSFTITNTGVDTIKVGTVDIKPLGGAFTVVSPTFPQFLSPGQSIIVQLRFAPTAAGVDTQRAAVFIEKPCFDLQYVSLRGRGIQGQLGTTPSALFFPDAWCPTERFRDSVSIMNTGTDTLSLFTATIAGAHAAEFRIVSQPSLPYKLKSGESVFFTVEYAPAALGDRSATLIITSADTKNPAISIALNARLRKASFTSPISLAAFGDVRIGVTSDLTVRVDNPNPLPARINRIVVIPSDPILSVLTSPPLTIAPNDTTAITIRFLPATDRVYTGFVRLYFDSPCSDSLTIPYAGRGVQGVARMAWNGVAPTIKCMSADGSVTIENSGTASFSIRALFIEGKDSSLFRIVNPPSLPFILDVGKTAALTLRFSPTAAPNGMKYAYVGLLLSGASTETLRVAISGERISPIVPASHADFGTVDIRYSGTALARIRNTEPTPATLTFLDVIPAEFVYRGPASFMLDQTNPQRDVPFEFFPRREGAFSGTARFLIEPCGDTAIVTFSGVGQRCRAAMAIEMHNLNEAPNYTVAMGATLTVPLLVTMPFGVDNVSRLQLRVTYNPTLLFPTNVARGTLTASDTLIWRIESPGRLTVTIFSASTLANNVGTLAVISFTGVIGDTLTSSIRLSIDSVTQKCITSATTGDATVTIIAPCEDRKGETLRLAASATMQQNNPNPFNASTTFEFTLPYETRARLSIYSLSGDKVATLFDKSFAAATHRVTLDTATIPSGIYLYVLETEREHVARKMVVTK